MKHIHMTAICGMGMGSLAGLLRQKGFEVSGSDANIYPPMSLQLQEMGIPLKEGFSEQNLFPQPDLVVIGNAVSKDNPEVQAVLQKGIPYLSMSATLEEFFLKGHYSIVVAGTHGKTTTCGLIAWLLEATGQSPSFLVGGILNNFSRSYQSGTGTSFVVEGDEYDSAFFDKKAKFLHYHPQTLILNAVEFDHADIYKDLSQVMGAFSELLLLMPPTGHLVACWDDPNVRKLIQQVSCMTTTFGLTEGASFRGDSLEFGPQTKFKIFHQEKELGSVISPLPGEHNVKNVLGAFAALLNLGIPFQDLAETLAEFKGVKKRQEVLGVVQGITLIDDFAHHPTAVYETLMALRKKYFGKGEGGKLWGVFEPRSNTTRRKVFQAEFVKAFDPADEILIAPVFHPEKIPEEERLDPETLVADLTKHGKKARYFPARGGIGGINEIVRVLGEETTSGDIICFMSNGGFGGIHQKVLKRIQGEKR